MLKQCHEIHIRWVSMTQYRGGPPFVSRLSPGLHVFFTPLKDQSEYVSIASSIYADAMLTSRSVLLCPLLRKVFGSHVRCVSPQVLEALLPQPPKRCGLICTGKFHSSASIIRALCFLGSIPVLPASTILG